MKAHNVYVHVHVLPCSDAVECGKCLTALGSAGT